MNQEVRKYIEQVILRYSVAHQEITSFACLTDTIEFTQHDVLKLLGIINAMADTLDQENIRSWEAVEFATDFKKTP